MHKSPSKFGPFAVVALIFIMFINIGALAAQSLDVNARSALIMTELPFTQENAASQQMVNERSMMRMNFLRSLKDQLTASRQDYKNVAANVEDASTRLEEVQGKVTTLNDQLANLNEAIDTSKRLMENVKMQIGEKENGLLLIYEDIAIKKAAIEDQKMILAEYLGALYEQENSMNDTMSGNEDINIAKLLLSDISVGEQLQNLKYLNVMENTGHKVFARLKLLLDEMQYRQKDMETQKIRLQELHQRLADEQVNLDIQYKAKAQLMEQTRGEEKIYANLFEESRKQQEQLQEDLRTLSDNLAFIEERMTKEGDSFNPDDYKSLMNSEESTVYAYINFTKDNADGFDPIWPVSPSRGISAYFHDGAYRKVFGFTHNAIDIRTPQGTAIHAPANGVVYKVRDNGYGYSYIIIAHEAGVMTVYGHVSEFRVREGDNVYAGQVIGLSGGVPGSKGAGLMTTGAHLHFEVMKGGAYADPLDYLPLQYLPINSLPEKYQSRLTGAEYGIRRTTDEDDSTVNMENLTQMVEKNGPMDQVVYGTVIQ